jgi:hypothetical protein
MTAQGDVDEAFATARQNLTLFEQFTDREPLLAYDGTTNHLRRSAVNQWRELATAHPEFATAAELAEMDQQAIESAVMHHVIAQAAQELAAQRQTPRAGLKSQSSFGDLFCALLVGLAPPLVVLLLISSVTAIGLSRLTKPVELPRLGFFSQSLALTVAFLGTITVLGLAPAEIVPPSVQNWVLTLLLLALLVAVCAWLTWRWFRKRRVKFTLRSLLLVLTAACFLAAIVAGLQLRTEHFVDLPLPLFIPARGWEGWDAQSLQTAMAPLGQWTWAAMQWANYNGHIATLALWGAMVAYLLFRRTGAMPSSCSADSRPTFRARCAAVARVWGGSVLTLSGLIVLSYLLVAPSVLRTAEADFQSKIAFARNPNAYWENVESAIQSVETNQVQMAQWEANAKAELAPVDSSVVKESAEPQQP